MAGKPIKKIVKLQITGGKANPAPPIGTVLGPTGINMQAFCSEFNDRTKDQMGVVIPAEITIYEDRSFSFTLKTPPATYLLKKAAGIESGSPRSHVQKVAKITDAQVTEIATLKMVDLSANDIAAAKKIIAGSARSMGIVVEN